MVSKCVGLNPGSTWRRREKLLRSNPEEIMSMTASATSTAINVEAARRLWRDAPRVPQVMRAEARMGASPKSRQTGQETAKVKARARASTLIFAIPGRAEGL